MEHIETKLELLKENLLDMTHVVKVQVQKSKQALFSKDDELASEVIANDKRVDNFELQIDQDCENILALYNPVAIDLRFILASLKISLSLERIGDHAEGICHSIHEIKKGINPVMLEVFKLNDMFDMAIRMLDDIFLAMENKDTKLAQKTFKRDLFLNKAHHKSVKTAVRWIKENPKDIKTILQLLNVVRKVERVGDLAKNISEEIIFHHDARILKHAPLSVKGIKKKQ